MSGRQRLNSSPTPPPAILGGMNDFLKDVLRAAVGLVAAIFLFGGLGAAVGSIASLSGRGSEGHIGLGSFVLSSDQHPVLTFIVAILLCLGSIAGIRYAMWGGRK